MIAENIGPGPTETGASVTVNLSLISHTNAGKTTLARTLLGQDVGEVRDAAHVTDVATGYVLVQAGSDTLMLWDTPGFGDTARLLSRLRGAGNPIGWLLSQVWDRWRERALWSSQQAVRNARENADVILYLVNAAEDPASAGYVALEMEVLAWIGKPVILLLNQMGPPRDDVSSEIERWSGHLADVAIVRDVLPLDAFARCWVQEAVLLDAVEPELAPDKRAAMALLATRWSEINHARFDQSMAALAGPLVDAMHDRAKVREGDWRDQVSQAIRPGKGQRRDVREAMEGLAERLAAGTVASTETLIRLHGLSGRATRTVLKRVGDDYARNELAPEGYSAMLGGIMSGVVGGLAADVAAGGLTLGGGMIIGGILGALGATGIARGVNLAKGDDGNAVRWSEEFVRGLIGAALLRYLAVAHFGRGRGDYEEGEHPGFWTEIVRTVVDKRKAPIARLYASGKQGEADAVQSMTVLLIECGSEILSLLYPGAARAADLDQLDPERSSPKSLLTPT
jgi:Domain of unknown function (DUF3482)/50S ribosome-binding GTPase